MRNKNGSAPLYLVVTAIIVSAIVIMGLLFSDNIKGALKKSFNKQNAGFEHYTQTTGVNAVR